MLLHLTCSHSLKLMHSYMRPLQQSLGSILYEGKFNISYSRCNIKSQASGCKVFVVRRNSLSHANICSVLFFLAKCVMNGIIEYCWHDTKLSQAEPHQKCGDTVAASKHPQTSQAVYIEMLTKGRHFGKRNDCLLNSFPFVLSLSLRQHGLLHFQKFMLMSDLYFP